MTTLTDHYNHRAREILLMPLWIILILDACERREQRRRKEQLALQRKFFQASIDESRRQYYRQVVETYHPPGLTGPRP